MVEGILNVYAGSFNIILIHTNQKISEFLKKWHSIGYSLLFFVIILQIFHMGVGLSLKFPIRPSPM